MKVSFETKRDYLTERKKLSILPIDELEVLLRELFNKRYIEQDINYESYYRLASSVHSQRSSQGHALVFHLKDFLR